MPEQVRIHLDEHIDSAIAQGLRRRGVEVTTTPELGLEGETDEGQLAAATRQGRAIFSFDLDFIALHNRGTSHAGILYCAAGRKTIGQLIDELEQIAKTFSPHDVRDLLWYL